MNLAVERGQALEQRGGRSLFAACGAFLLIVNGQRLRQGAGARQQPAGQQRGKGLGVHAREQRVEDAVAGDFVKGARAGLARQAELTALRLAQGGGETGDLGEVAPPRQQRHGDERAHGAGAILRVGIARIGRAAEHVQEGLPLRLRDREHARGRSNQTRATLLAAPASRADGRVPSARARAARVFWAAHWPRRNPRDAGCNRR